MLVFVAALLFLIALVLNIVHAGHVEALMLAGLFFLALGIALGGVWVAAPWRRNPPAV